MSVILLSCVAQASNPECYQLGECTQSLYVGDWDMPNLQTCLEECRRENGCQYFTYYERDEICLGFANCAEFDDKSCDFCYSGSQDCPGTVQYILCLVYVVLQ